MGALLGVAFWILAAHRYSAVQVGNGAAEISAMTLIASISQFSPGLVFNRFLFAAGHRAGRILVVGYGSSTLFALVISVIFLTATRRHNFVAGGWAPGALFIAATVVWVIFTIEDAALTGLRATFIIPIENTLFSLAKLTLLPVLALRAANSNGVFLAWVVPLVFIVIPVNYFLFRKVIPRHTQQSLGQSSLPPRGVLGRIVVGEYFGSLALIALTSMPAILIVNELGGAQAAYFQTPWLVGTSFDFLLWTFAFAVMSESSARPSGAPATIRKAVKLATIVLSPVMGLLVLGAPLYMRVLGHEYAHNGTRLLQLLVLTLPFMATNILYVTFASLARRVRRVIFVQVSLSVGTLTLMSILMRHLGLTGVGIAFMIGQACVAMIVLPSVVRQYRRPLMSPGFAPDSGAVINAAQDS